jgi:hypothetical protein
MDGYTLTRNWFNFCFENSKCKPIHTAIYLWAVELNNRMGWKKEFGFPTQSNIEGLKIGNKRTYLSALDDLIEWGFIKVITESKNQFQATIITLFHVKKATARVSALDTALGQISHSTGIGTGITIAPIDKQLNKETIKQTKKEFELFWDMYDYKKGNKDKTKKTWDSLTVEIQDKIFETLPFFKLDYPDKKFRPHPATYLNGKRWNEELKHKPVVYQQSIVQQKIIADW